MASDTRLSVAPSPSAPAQNSTTSGLHLPTVLLYLFAIYILFSTVFTLATFRVLRVLMRPRAVPLHPTENARRHLLVVLGSGGHTSEMLSILQNLGAEYLNTRFAQRMWIVSTGDGFSAERASRFEKAVAQEWADEHEHKHKHKELTAKNNEDVNVNGDGDGDGNIDVHWDIVTVTRARKVHQPLYTTPISALVCLWDCIRVLRGSLRATTSSAAGATAASAGFTPDLILTNGPGTGVIVVLASLVLLVLGLAPLQGRGSMRCVYVESWARVKTLSLSGKMLRWMVSRFLVQWKGLADENATALVADAPKNSDADAVGMSQGRAAVGASSMPGRIEFVGAVVT